MVAQAYERQKEPHVFSSAALLGGVFLDVNAGLMPGATSAIT
jgi:hypothetical protein